MNYAELTKRIEAVGHGLCVGLDPDPAKLPTGTDLASFCVGIIDATAHVAVAYKPNFAFFEALGRPGWDALDAVTRHLRALPQKPFLIADAKRGDIGNTAARYAQGILEVMGYDAVTVAPYMGRDSVEPFLRDGKWVVGLGLTSNPGADDLQQLPLEDGRRVYEAVADAYLQWGRPDNLMVVAGATRPEALGALRDRMPDTFFLVPGVGAQGGSAEDVVRHGAFRGKPGMGLLINASRSIMYASNGSNWREAATQSAEALAAEITQAYRG
ncbi:MAG: orotidine-5'-phosphate decarboxylase [Bacteroidota bacterium]|jgi:orotidine-5'-phosphate decarboxylase